MVHVADTIAITASIAPYGATVSCSATFDVGTMHDAA